MTAITYIEHNGTAHKVDVDNQMNLMEGATLNMVPGVLGQCGGLCSCATCHCYVPPEWQSKIPPASQDEEAMLEGVSFRRENSRLGCQIVVTDALNGMTVHLPEDQGD